MSTIRWSICSRTTEPESDNERFTYKPTIKLHLTKCKAERSKIGKNAWLRDKKGPS